MLVRKIVTAAATMAHRALENPAVTAMDPPMA